MVAYYNDNDPYAAQWLRNLIARNLIAFGIVDERPIQEVDFTTLAKFTQCHFFAGVGVWSYALRCAGWPDDRPIWTASCPCQPFSGAGKRGGIEDDRHLWPWICRAIEIGKPGVVIGEQVSSPDGLTWWDAVQTDFESANYAAAALDLCVPGVGSPHIRQRLYWLAYANDARSQRWGERGHCAGERLAGANGLAGGMADVMCDGRVERGTEYGQRSTGRMCSSGGLVDAESCAGRVPEGCEGQHLPESRGASALGGLDDSACKRHRANDVESVSGRRERAARSADSACTHGESATNPLNGFWRDSDWLFCRDGKWRPVEPGTFPLVDGAPNRVGRLRAYGNAICAPQATEFIKTVMECLP